MGCRRAAVIILLAIGCGAPQEPEAGCAAACVNLRALQCPEGEPAEDGATCEEFCEEAEGSGLVDIDTTCLSELESCGDYDVCTE